MGGKKHLRGILAVILGALVGTIVFFVVAAAHNAVKPTPSELMDPATPEAVVRRVAATPTSTWLVTMSGLALGAFVGGIVGAGVSKERRLWVTSVVGLALSPWAFYTFYVVFPAVLWVPVGMLISVLLFTYLGGVVMVRVRK